MLSGSLIFVITVVYKQHVPRNSWASSKGMGPCLLEVAYDSILELMKINGLPKPEPTLYPTEKGEHAWIYEFDSAVIFVQGCIYYISEIPTQLLWANSKL